MLGTGTVAAHAAWTASAPRSASVTTASVATTAAGVGALDVVYRSTVAGVTGSNNVAAGLLVDTVPITVRNTGTAPLSYTVTVANGTTAFNSRVVLAVWKQNGTCTNATTPDAATVTTGSLTAPPVLNAAIATIAAAGQTVFCVRTTLGGNFSDSAGTSTAPSIGFTGRVGTNWTASTTSTTITQSAVFTWFQLIHDYSSKCLDVDGGNAAAAGVNIILYPCHQAAVNNNQAFRFEESNGGWYRIFVGTGTKAGPVIRTGSGDVDLAAVTTGDAEASLRQQWKPVAHGDAGDYQIVNRFDNTCLRVVSSNDRQTISTIACTTSTVNTTTEYRAQHFRLPQIP